jgi:predicted nucleic acid-binding protein
VSGNKIFLDTNAFIYFFEGRKKITELVIQTPGIYYSVISEIELLSAKHLTEGEITQIEAFLSLCQRIDLNSEIIAKTIEIRKQYNLKIPDAIIAATALNLKMPLVFAELAPPGAGIF